ncbi:2-oxoacid ferredoxin oxidoreductase alpha subunit [Pyrobaculum aerophilum str. IM2]|uniref:2-oxoacid oxidoreductase (ferredoxin) n=2 Tax=Pyrobaculum aerophilum TaxID=13773 RepID=Q8ZY55_PYRAE|nr:2-oxoacid:acceptor oxidoreductase subunit alpha [Pyrobaculum aerophilum]AAL63141.1 2-oxoacid ferredoxin oxidoreductase alpha subunit [Pyrobaculum aerophilum str. IM2]HII48095.1 2-oxoacid:acceptor oxidoreductase subunit alpha [Pyrobaculum aerophilum]
MNISFLIGGPQGRGVETASFMFIYGVGSAGYYVYARREFWSNIAGGRHSYVVGTISESWPAPAPGNSVELALMFDGHAVLEHVFHLKKGSYLIYNSEEDSKTPDNYTMMSKALAERLKKFAKENGFEPTVKGYVDYLRQRGVEVIGLPYNKHITEIGRKIGVTSPVMLARFVNTFVVALGAALLGLSEEYVARGVGFALGKKADVIEQNKKVAIEAMKLVEKRIATLKPREPDVKRVFWNGNEASAYGKIVGGIRFVSYYPITPATDDAMTFERLIPYPISKNAGELAKYEKIGAVAFQAEDELAAVAIATGGAIAGARAATTTSGPGFSLMAEALSMAGMMEVGLVVTLWMRSGPSTGQATRQAQQDLLFSLFIGHGEYPKIVYASGDLEEVFLDNIRVANWAEKFRVPVIHLLDKNLSNTFAVMPLPDPAKVKIETVEPVIYPQTREAEAYPLNKVIPPRLLPGVSNAIFHLNSLEHDPEGDPEEDPVVVREMFERRMAKLKLIEREIPPDEKIIYYGPRDAKRIIVGWGSTKPAILTALNELRDVGFLYIKMLYPFPADLVKKHLESKETMFVENNYLGQLAMITRMFAGIEPTSIAVKYNGRPITTDDVLDAYRKFEAGEKVIKIDTDL